jgi:hypothetical protein
MKIYHVTKDWGKRIEVLNKLGLSNYISVNGLSPFDNPTPEKIELAKKYEKDGLIELRNIP